MRLIFGDGLSRQNDGRLIGVALAARGCLLANRNRLVTHGSGFFAGALAVSFAIITSFALAGFAVLKTPPPSATAPSSPPLARAFPFLLFFVRGIFSRLLFAGRNVGISGSSRLGRGNNLIRFQRPAIFLVARERLASLVFLRMFFRMSL